jgi:hypothetical protein
MATRPRAPAPASGATVFIAKAGEAVAAVTVAPPVVRPVNLLVLVPVIPVPVVVVVALAKPPEMVVVSLEMG